LLIFHHFSNGLVRFHANNVVAAIIQLSLHFSVASGYRDWNWPLSWFSTSGSFAWLALKFCSLACSRFVWDSVLVNGLVGLCLCLVVSFVIGWADSRVILLPPVSLLGAGSCKSRQLPDFHGSPAYWPYSVSCVLTKNPDSLHRCFIYDL